MIKDVHKIKDKEGRGTKIKEYVEKGFLSQSTLKEVLDTGFTGSTSKADIKIILSSDPIY